jgi:HEPN domain-containing protein
MTNQTDQLVAAWIEKGDHDLGSAKVIFQYIPDYFDTIAFHCQQAVEKYLKAMLIYYNIDFQKVHDLTYLLELLSRSMEIDSELFHKAITLNNFAVEIRYPNQTLYLTREELIEAFEIAEEFRELVLNRIKNNFDGSNKNSSRT